MSYIGKTPTSVPLTSSDITNGIISLPKLTDGTDGNLISYDANGNPVAVATGNDGQVLTSTGAGSPPAFETLASEANTPSFQVLLSSSQSLNNSANVVIAFDTEIFDTDNAVSSGVFTVPSGKGGKYFFTVNGGIARGQEVLVNMWLSKNSQTTIATTSGNAISIDYTHFGASDATQVRSLSGTFDLNASDTVRVYIYHDASNATDSTNKGRFTFSGHKLI